MTQASCQDDPEQEFDCIFVVEAEKMGDVHSPEVRSRNMAAVRSRNTKPEVRLRHALWHHGLRFFTSQGYNRLSKKSVPGSPDILFPSVRLAVFVDGCFWHGCPVHYTAPETNSEFWRRKLCQNLSRDRRVTEELRKQGWTVLRVWEHELEGEGLMRIVESIESMVKGFRRSSRCVEG